uniref:complement component C1q receptor-like n=2 Tax=Myxine glutinosa TaxID=7769 RepID=UPI00358EB77E
MHILVALRLIAMQLLFVQIGSFIERVEVHQIICVDKACYTLYAHRLNFMDARTMCQRAGGTLTTMRSLAEAKVLQEIIAASEEGHAPVDQGMKLWMGLRRNRRQCYEASKPLRGFHWLTGDDDSSFSVWLKEPAVTCAVDRCVVITYHPASLKSHGNLVLKWQEGNCYIRTEFICKFSPLGLCPAPRYANQPRVTYRTPYGFSDRPLDLAPEGSTATTTCDATGREISARCKRRPGAKTFGWTPEPCKPDPAPGACRNNNGQCEHLCVLSGGSTGRLETCACRQGYQLAPDGLSCLDIDECAHAETPCPQVCINTKGSFQCECAPGYEERQGGKRCVDSDECESSPCEQLCINFPGSFSCHCADGFELLRGERGCERVREDACQRTSCQHRCQHMAPARAQCFCHAGFVLEGNGVNCSDVDECETMSPCLHRCTNLPGEFYCSCFDGYHLANDRSTCLLNKAFTTGVSAGETTDQKMMPTGAAVSVWTLMMNGVSTNMTSSSTTLSSSTRRSFTHVFHQGTQSASVRIKQGERSDLNVRQKRGADRLLLAVMAASVLIILVAIIACLVSYHQVEEQERKNKARCRGLRLKNPSEVGTSVDGTEQRLSLTSSPGTCSIVMDESAMSLNGTSHCASSQQDGRSFGSDVLDVQRSL